MFNKDPFRPPIHNDEILGPKVPYLSAIGALMSLANNTRPDIAFSVNLLARYSSTPTKRHWNGVKHILRSLRGTSDMGLYFERHENAKATNLVGYSDAGYLSDPHKVISQSGYVFMYGGTAISWRSTKQTLVATLSNHAVNCTETELGRPPKQMELFAKCYKKKTYGGWSGMGTAEVATFQKLVEDHQPQPVVEDHDTSIESEASAMAKQQLWLAAVGGKKKGLVFGLGFEAHFSSRTYMSPPPPPSPNMEDCMVQLKMMMVDMMTK
ncbi:hypothetical protein Sango_1166300 [Sesamum angolense]|uniref:Uncharacterized protein n=1 Tax=Sesamum angolense TaxID=2727404 RepID=A0AAE1WWW3_9LAMI|nr:hypothetical protein Sango_1166300 [Sesamum angolense]